MINQNEAVKSAGQYVQEITEAEQGISDARLAKLAGFSGTLAKKLKEAKDHRRLSGIEQIWEQDDSHYSGSDSANTGDMLKGSSPAGRVTMRNQNVTNSTKSTAFINITAPYVDQASARVADMVLPTDDRPFAIKLPPVPDITEASKDDTTMMPGGVHTVGQASSMFLAELQTKADAAEDQIWTWLIGARWHSEVRKVIEQSARIGTGCLKGPFPKKVKNRKMTTDEHGQIRLVLEEVIKPSSKAVDVWNLFPDPSCGENIHNGSYIFERDYISARQLRDLKGTGYIDSEIDAVLKEGPSKINVDTKNNKIIDTDNYEIWYYHGMANTDDLAAAGCECDDSTATPVIVSMINDRVIKASLSLLDSGEFPYDVMCWQRRSDFWAGLGVARQVRTAQRMVNAATRNLMDNAGLSAGVQIIMRDGVIYPADGSWEITPMKIWRVDEDSTETQVQHAITTIAIPSMQVELQNIIKMAQDFAEKATSMPLMMSGQMGSAPDTVGGLQILTHNSNTVLRRLAGIYDDSIIEPHVMRYYQWLMIYGEDWCKGDFLIDALGSSSFFQRDATNMAIMNMVQQSLNPAFNLDPAKLMVEVAKIQRISPERVFMTPEQIKQRQEEMQKNPPQNPAVQVAQIRSDSIVKAAQLKTQSDTQESQAKAQAAQAAAQVASQEFNQEQNLKMTLAQKEHENKMALAEITYKIELMRLAESSKQSLEQVKASLATVSMKLNVQQKLSGIDQANQLSQDSLDKQHDHTSQLSDILHQKETQAADHRHEQTMQTLTPPTEPSGKSSPGEAWQA